MATDQSTANAASYKSSDLQTAKASGASFTMVHKMGLLTASVPAASTADNVIVYNGNTYNSGASGEKWTRITAECTTVTWNASTTFTSSTNKPYKSGSTLFYMARPGDSSVSISASSGTQLYAWSVSGAATTTGSSGTYKAFTIASPDYTNAFNKKIWKFSYSGTCQQWVAPHAGSYTMECWGAGGGTGYKTGYDASAFVASAGKGGYTICTKTIAVNNSCYVTVGGAGGNGALGSFQVTPGGYNGGGAGAWNSIFEGVVKSDWYGRAGSGGGATHIGLKTGLLTAFSSDYATKLLIVAGGGGGGCVAANSFKGHGGAGGGTSGTNGGAGNGNPNLGYAGGQTSSNGTVFGQGGTRNNNTGYQPGGGGGGGFYGGVAGGYGGTIYGGGGGGGSGYVNTSLVSGSTTAGTSSFVSPTGGNETGHSGNGYARITYVKP